jgi:DHA1 family tetracycline resistance protein-like MFS transporter
MIQPATIFLLLTVAIDAIGIALIVPVMPELLQQVTGGNLANAALWGGVLSTIYAMMQFLFAPLLGHLSDLFGRRPVLLISLAVMVVDYLIMATTGWIIILLLARAVGGVTAATHSTANAAMADLMPPDQRAQGFGLLGAAFGLGFVLGPVIGGFLGAFATRAPFWAAAALSAANLALGYFAFPETNTTRRSKFSFARANPFGAFAALSRLRNVGRGLGMYFMYQLAFAVYPAVWAYFTTARFGWDPLMIGMSLAMFGIGMAVAQAGLIRLIIARIGERGAVVFGLGFIALAYGLTAVVTSGTVALILTPIAALGGVFTPAIQAIMSRATPNDRQGELQGVLASTSAIANALSPMMMTATFAYFTRPDALIFLPGAPFVLSFLLVIATLFLFVTERRPRV